MTTTSEVRPGDAVRFVPFARRNSITVLVDEVTHHTGVSMFHGFRLNAEGLVDSQSRHHAWPVAPDAQVEVVPE